MRPDRLATLLVGVAAILPWFALIPTQSALVAVITASFAIVAAFHGFGVTLARGLDREGNAPLRMLWGVAIAVGLGGIATALGIFTSAAQAALVFAGVALHTAGLVVDRRTLVETLAARLRRAETRYWLAPLSLIAVLAFVHVLGAAGDVGGRSFDDETNVLSQLRRLADTGALADGIGFPRSHQLGGSIVLSSLASIAGDGYLFQFVDSGLGIVLLQLAIVGAIRPHDATSSLWALLVVLALSALAVVVQDPATCWIAAGLCFAAFHEAARSDREPIVLALLAGALVTLRQELYPVAVIVLFGARGSVSRRLVIALAVGVAVVGPYVVARARTDELATIFAPRVGSLGGRLAITVLVFALVAPLLSMLARDRGKLPALATALGVAAIVGQLSGDRPYATRFAWPIAIAFVAWLTCDAARRPVRTTSLLLVFTLVLAIFDGRDELGRARWSRRQSELALDIAYLRSAHTHRDVPDDYAVLLANVAGDKRVALWVTRPEQIDHDRHRLVDLRTPWLDAVRSDPRKAGKLVDFIRELDVDYLLVEADHEQLQRLEREPLAWWCALTETACADDFERFVATAPTIAERPGVRLVALRP